MISKLVSDFIEKISLEIKDPKNMDKINRNIINPVLYSTLNQIYPHLIFISCIFILTFIMALLCLIFVIRLQLNNNLII